MKNKKFVMFALSVVALALLISSVSALTLTASPNPITFTGIANSQNLVVTSDNSSLPNVYTTNIIFPLTDANGNLFPTAFLIQPTSINNSTSSQTTFNITLTNTINANNANFIYGNSYSATLNVSGNYSGNSNYTNVNLTYFKSFCQNGDFNDTSNIPLNVQITNQGTSSSSNPTNWNPLDTITVQVRLNNYNSNLNLNNVAFDIALFQQGTNNNIINQMIWPNQNGYSSYQAGGVSSNSNSVATFVFRVDPAILSNHNGVTSYILAVRASGSNFCVDHSTDLSSLSGGSSIYFANININPPNYNQAVVIDQNTLPLSTSTSCGQQATINPTVYNIGTTNSFSQNQILVTLTNPELGINLNQTIYGGLNAGQGQQLPFTFTIPQNANEGIHHLQLIVYYDYNSYTKSYLYYSKAYATDVNIQGGCVYATPDTTGVTAQLVSGGNTGSPMVITATVTNKGNRTVSYNFGAEGYTSWATLTGISPSNVTLAPGQSQDVTLNMNVNQNANGGNQLLYLDTYSNGYLITKQPIQVPITAGFSLSSITGSVTGTTALVWGLGILIIVLIVVIIIVAVRLRKK